MANVLHVGAYRMMVENRILFISESANNIGFIDFITIKLLNVIKYGVWIKLDSIISDYRIKRAILQKWVLICTNWKTWLEFDVASFNFSPMKIIRNAQMHENDYKK